MRPRVPAFPLPARDEPTLEVVDDAFLTRVERGPLRTVGRPHRYLRGAVHDAGGRLVRASQKTGVPGHPWVPADPGRVQVNPRARTLPGRWLYGGHWMQHFGHFLVETLPTLWPTGQEVTGLVFHQYHRRPVAREQWMLRLLELAGYGGLPVEVVDGRRNLRVERLVVPSRTVVADGWGHPPAREVWERVAAPFRDVGGPDRVYLSRTAFNENRRRAGHPRARGDLPRDRALDAAFAEAGFVVAVPELLPIDDQLRLVADARVVAGGSGSALHLTAFAPRGTQVVELGDERNPGHPLGLQLVVDRLGEHPHLFLPPTHSIRQVRRRIRRVR